MKNESQKLEQLAKYQAEISKATKELKVLKEKAEAQCSESETPEEFAPAYKLGMITGNANGIAIRIEHFNNLITELFKS